MLSTIPTEIVCAILAAVPIDEHLQQLALVCKRWSQILAFDLSFAREHISRRAGDVEQLVDFNGLPLTYAAALLHQTFRSPAVSAHGSKLRQTMGASLAVKSVRWLHAADGDSSWTASAFVDGVLPWALSLGAGAGAGGVVDALYADARCAGLRDPAAANNAAVRLLSKHGHAAAVARLLADSRVDPAANAHEALRMAALHGRDAVVAALAADARCAAQLRHAAVGGFCAFSAAKMGHAKVLRVLAAAAPDMDLSNGLLRVAVQEGHVAVVALLLDHKSVDPNELDCAALKVACGEGNVEITRLLLKDKRIDPAVDDNSPLRMACSSGVLPLVSLLLSLPGTDPSAAANDCLYRALHKKHASILSLLLADPRVNPRTHFLQACDTNDVSIVSQFLRHPLVDPRIDDHAAICIAANQGASEIVELLLKDGRIDPSIDNDLPIRAAAENGHAEVVSMLLKDARVNPRAHNDEALESAVKMNHVEVISLLSKHFERMDTQ